ncbi:MAG: glycerophosphodiester phosphodiesterase [Chloroflexota bacterium]|nr:glycerophosphodiester phosphodiesterase [Chloroflexota bacterium]
MNRQVNPNVLNIAHRGARSVAPENTLAAARKALEIGADMWELDVCMSVDGVPYLAHDDTLTRTSNVTEIFPNRHPWASHAFTWEEIQQLDFGSWFNRQDPLGQIAIGNVSEAEQVSFIGDPAPSLEQALRFTRDNDWRVNIEIKDLSGTSGDATVVEEVVSLIEALGMEELVLISSFNHPYLKRARAANPTIPTAALVNRPASDPTALVKQLGAQAYNPGLVAIRPSQIPAIRDADIDVYVWTVNDEATMHTLIQHHVSGIITDFPQRLKRVLNSRVA